MIKTEPKLKLKKRMLDACIRKQTIFIRDFEKRLTFIQSSEALSNESYDLKDLATKSQQEDELTVLRDQLRFARQEMETLQRLQSDLKHRHTQADLGAVVITGHRSFYICISIEEFQVKGKHYIGLSVQSPLFLAMRGKQTGDQFTWKQETYTITSIF